MQALAVYLCQYQLIPYKRAAEFFRDIYGIPVSEGTLCRFRKKPMTTWRVLKSRSYKLLSETVLGADETSARLSNCLWWLHVSQ